MIDTTANEVNITRSTFRGNSASMSIGGAIFGDGMGVLRIRDSKFFNNYLVPNGTSTSLGGAVNSNVRHTPLILHCTAGALHSTASLF
jgi:hypothetical protein